MRQYQPILNQVRDHGIAKIRAPIDMQHRIIQAVRKEKTRDLVHSLSNADNRIDTTLRQEIMPIRGIESTTCIITFTLEVTKSTKIDVIDL